MKTVQCAPGVNPMNGTCYRKEHLDKIARHHKIKVPRSLNHGQMLGQIKKSLSCGNGSNDLCLIQGLPDPVKDSIVDDALRPPGPEGKFDWLATNHINRVMSQYEKLHQDFLFLGAVPMDFDSLPQLGIRDLPLQRLYNEGTRRIGIIFNTDDHYQPGQHWVAGYTDLGKGQVYFFDSVADMPDERAVALLARFAKASMKARGRTARLEEMDIDVNNVRHQFANTECGVYSMNFIIRLLNGTSFREIVNNPTLDSNMNECRSVYFNKFGGKKRR